MMSKPSSTMVILGVILYNEVTQYKHCLAPATQLGDKMVKLKKMLSKPVIQLFHFKTFWLRINRKTINLQNNTQSLFSAIQL